jgi:signal transduction histidine kinase
LDPVRDDQAMTRSAYDAIEDPATLRRLLGATVLLESNLHLGGLLSRIVDEAISLARARYGALGVLDSAGTEVIEFFESGLHSDAKAALVDTPLPTGHGVLGVLIDDPRPIRIKRIGDHPASVGFPPGHPPMTSFLGAPIKVRDRVYGNLYLTEKIGADEFTVDDEAVIEALALAAGIAVENARLHQRAAEIAVYEERDRMARDLHDGVIQRLFAIGLSLQGLTTGEAGRALAGSIGAVEEDIDETIRQVRTTIFELGTEGRGRGIRSSVLAMIEELQPVLGFRVPVDFAGTVESSVSDEVAEQLLATLREALSNVARHARATTATVALAVAGRACRLEVHDDGQGMVGSPSPGGGHGLPNMRSRAESLGGTFEVLQPAGGGTTLVWQVPAFAGPAPRDGPGDPAPGLPGRGGTT